MDGCTLQAKDADTKKAQLLQELSESLSVTRVCKRCRNRLCK